MNRGLIGALSLGVAFALLTGCGGSQPPIGVPGAVPQSRAIATHAARGKSWMLPEAKYEDLPGLMPTGNQTKIPLTRSSPRSATLIGSTATKGDLLYIGGLSDSLGIYSYPQGRHLATIDNLYVVGGICSDPHGNVFVPAIDTKSQSTVYEFAHGGTTPIATLSDPGYATACSYDPITGNLAVANDGPNVAIFEHAQGDATTYQTSTVPAFFCAYDEKGNLFIDDGMDSPSLGELPAGKQSFEEITLDRTFFPMSLQWVNGHFAIAAYTFDPRGPQPFYNVTIYGNKGVTTGPIMLSSKNGKHADAPVQFFLKGNTMIGPLPHSGGFRYLGFWKYPTGGATLKTQKTRVDPINAVAISVAP